MIHSRTFHPVGQGAFYSEIHKFGKELFTFVYDCGSTNQKYVKNAINNTFDEGYIIDLLFLSHFHSDHISGVDHLRKRCKIKNVYLPLLHPSQINIAKSEAMLVNSNKNINNENIKFQLKLIENPEEAFRDSETRVFRVNAADSFDSKFPAEAHTHNNNIKTIESGKEIYFKENAQDWLFIPYNYAQVMRLHELKCKLKHIQLKNGIKDDLYQALMNFNWSILSIPQNKKAVKEAYSDVGGVNENSMILLSAPKTSNPLPYGNEKHPSILLYPSRQYTQHNAPIISNLLKPGFLYTGDINLNSKGVFESITREYSNYWPSVGSIQIPHHGSYHNYYEFISQWGIKSAVISYGEKNIYRHPSPYVLENLFRQGIDFYLITEDNNRELTFQP